MKEEASGCTACMGSIIRWNGVIDLAVSVLICVGGVAVSSFGVSFESFVLSCVLLLAGILVAILAIINIAPLSKYFLFANRFWGRGGLYVFLGVLILGTAPLRMIAGGISIATGIVYLVMSVYPGSPRPQPLTGWTWCTGEPEEPVVPSAAENRRHSGGRTNLQISSPSSVISASGQAKDPNPFVPTPHQAAIRAEQAGQADGEATFTVDVGPALSGSNPFTN